MEEKDENSYFQEILKSITPDEQEILRKYSAKGLRRVDEEDVPSLQRLQKEKGVIWHSGSGDIEPGQYVGLSIFGVWIYDALIRGNQRLT